MSGALLVLLAFDPVRAWAGESALPPGKDFPRQEVYASSSLVENRGGIDRLLFEGWKAGGIAIPRKASDYVMVRRAYLDLTGRLPKAGEARSYAESQDKDKFGKLVNRLVLDDGFVDLWTMRWCDALHVKSEAPINLWPNAVYVYQRRIRELFKNREPYDRFARALLLSSGSNFRVPETNFYRALTDRSPQGIASAAASFFMGRNFEEWPEEKKQRLAAFFTGVSYKSTLEWKEEIVFVQPFENDSRLLYPDGTGVVVPAGADPREAFCRYLFSTEEKHFSEAVVRRMWFYLLGGDLDGVGEKGSGTMTRRKILDYLAGEFKKSGYDLTALCRLIVKSSAYQASFLPEGNGGEAVRHFAAYCPRRMEAEVLDDVLSDTIGRPRAYISVIPEPFTYIPADSRTVTLADGSVSSSFLTLFGRSPRDSGLLTERDNTLSAKQKQYLFNSGEIYKCLGKLVRQADFRALEYSGKVDCLYRLFYSRPPLEQEKSCILRMFTAAKGREKGDVFFQNLGWILINSKEFIYNH